MEDWFDIDCPTKYLHFFQDNSKKLHILDLEEAKTTGNYKFEELELNINFKIPIWHRSIITRQGVIYLTGGSEANAKRDKNSDAVYIFDPIERTLKPKAKLNFARNSHGIAILQDHIYVVGGCVDDEGYTDKCERYEISKYYEKTVGGWEVIAPLNHPAYAPCLAAFNDTYLYKFGGILSLNEMNNYVERYDPRSNKWTEIKYQVFGANSIDFCLMAYASCYQINEKEIYIFGGSEFDAKSNQTYLLRIDDGLNIIQKTDVTLPYFGIFWNNGIVHQNKLYCLQNVQLSKSDAFFLGKRKVLCYDGTKWKEILLN